MRYAAIDIERHMLMMLPLRYDAVDAELRIFTRY